MLALNLSFLKRLHLGKLFWRVKKKKTFKSSSLKYCNTKLKELRNRVLHIILARSVFYLIRV